VLIEGTDGPALPSGEGDRYTGRRPHASARLIWCAAHEAVDRPRPAGQPVLAAAVEAAARSCQSLDDQTFYADNVRRLERSYLRAESAPAGSGFGGDERKWRQAASTPPMALLATARSWTSAVPAGC
jgi:hypothetical protein